MSNDRTDRPWDDPRVQLAAERTLLAWIRTGLALMGFGFVVARFGLLLQELRPHDAARQSDHWASVLIGPGLVITGVAVNVLAVVRHRMLVRRLERGETLVESPFSLAVVVSLVLASIGILMAIRLVAAGQ